jgi:hypothetical protein
MQTTTDRAVLEAQIGNCERLAEERATIVSAYLAMVFILDARKGGNE